MDTIKHIDYFNPSCIKGNIGVVGVGATGSATALKLAKLSLENLILFDDDKIENHNLSNQILYGPKDLGKYKTISASQSIHKLTGYKSKYETKKLTVKTQLSHNNIQTVFICVDSMKARKDIFEKSIFLNGTTTLLIDMRIAARSVNVISINPSDMDHVELYRSTLYSDSVVPKQLGNCGVTPTIAATAGMAADFSIWRFMDWVSERDKNIFDINLELPSLLIHRTFKDAKLDLEAA